MKTVLVSGLVVIALLMVIQVNSDFSNYDAGRINFVKVVNPEDAFIGYSCGEKVTINSCCDKCDGSENAVLTVYNNINVSVSVNVSFYEWLGSNPDISIEVVDGDFVILPNSQKTITAKIDGGSSEGSYFAVFQIRASWINGDAKIFTTVCPVEVVIKKPTIRKYLISGDTTVKTHTCETWTFVIEVENDGKCKLVVKDTIPGEFNITSYSASTGPVSISKQGKSEHIKWFLKDSGTLKISIETALNPAGKREFTSPGTYTLNDGAVISKCNLWSDAIKVTAED